MQDREPNADVGKAADTPLCRGSSTFGVQGFLAVRRWHWSSKSTSRVLSARCTVRASADLDALQLERVCLPAGRLLEYAGAGYKGMKAAGYVHELELGLQVAGLPCTNVLSWVVEVPHPLTTAGAGGSEDVNTVHLEA